MVSGITMVWTSAIFNKGTEEIIGTPTRLIRTKLGSFGPRMAIPSTLFQSTIQGGLNGPT